MARYGILSRDRLERGGSRGGSPRGWLKHSGDGHVACVMALAFTTFGTVFGARNPCRDFRTWRSTHLCRAHSRGYRDIGPAKRVNIPAKVELCRVFVFPMSCGRCAARMNWSVTMKTDRSCRQGMATPLSHCPAARFLLIMGYKKCSEPARAACFLLLCILLSHSEVLQAWEIFLAQS